jgi:hypothetical protein
MGLPLFNGMQGHGSLVRYRPAQGRQRSAKILDSGDMKGIAGLPTGFAHFSMAPPR